MSKKRQKDVSKKEKDTEVNLEVPAEETTVEEKEPKEVKVTVENPEIEDESIDTVGALAARIAELEDEVLRQRAETENFKRRTKQEYETNLKYANQHLIEQFLPVLDGFDRALATQDATDEATKQFLKGFEMIDGLLKQTLQNAGLTVIPTVGEQFDPYLHQAVAQDTDETKAEDEILEELQRGYKLKDRVIRASMVKTNKK